MNPPHELWLGQQARVGQRCCIHRETREHHVRCSLLNQESVDSLSFSLAGHARGDRVGIGLERSSSDVFPSPQAQRALSRFSWNALLIDLPCEASTPCERTVGIGRRPVMGW